MKREKLMIERLMILYSGSPPTNLYTDQPPKPIIAATSLGRPEGECPAKEDDL